MTGSITAKIITETADAIVSSGLKDKGYEYVCVYHLSTCYPPARPLAHAFACPPACPPNHSPS
jgi:hypothetical protein